MPLEYFDLGGPIDGSPRHLTTWVEPCALVISFHSEDAPKAVVDQDTANWFGGLFARCLGSSETRFSVTNRLRVDQGPREWDTIRLYHEKCRKNKEKMERQEQAQNKREDQEDQGDHQPALEGNDE